MARWRLLLAAGAVVLAAGCSSSRSTPIGPRDGGDSKITFPDAWGDLFVPPAGSSLRGEPCSGAAAAQGGDLTLFGVVGEPFASVPSTGGGYSLQWDSVVLPVPDGQ